MSAVSAPGDGSPSAFPYDPSSFHEPPQNTYFIGVPEELDAPAVEVELADHDDFGAYNPMRTLCEIAAAAKDSPKRAAALAELKRFSTRTNRPFTIPLWEQACVKHVFRDAFDPHIDVRELQALGTLLLTVVINIAVVSINVFGEQQPSFVASAALVVRVVFIVELAVVYLFTAFLILTIADAAWRKNVGTNVAVDVVETAQIISSFSTLKIVGVVSPGFVVQRVLPIFSTVQTAVDRVKAGVMILLWLLACCVAVLTIVAKVSQVGFASTQPVEEWSWSEILQMLGLVLNLAKVDESYAAEMRTLLGAVHRHYCGPGGPDSENPREEGLFSKVLTFFGVPRGNSHEYFESVFDHHFGVDDEDKLTLRQKLQKTLNFMAFVTKIDTIMLRRFLQMTQSPIYYYTCGRQAFKEALKGHDVTSMEIALWRSDPYDETTLLAHRDHPERFRQVYKCMSPDDRQ